MPGRIAKRKSWPVSIRGARTGRRCGSQLLACLAQEWCFCRELHQHIHSTPGLVAICWPSTGLANWTCISDETGLSVAGNGQITFASGQTFPGTGSVTSVGSGAGLTGGPITSSGSLSIAPGGVGNAMLSNPSLTVTAGTDLTGGGTVPLGGTTTLNLDTTKVPQLASANTFTGNQTVTEVLRRVARCKAEWSTPRPASTLVVFPQFWPADQPASAWACRRWQPVPPDTAIPL